MYKFLVHEMKWSRYSNTPLIPHTLDQNRTKYDSLGAPFSPISGLKCTEGVALTSCIRLNLFFRTRIIYSFRMQKWEKTKHNQMHEMTALTVFKPSVLVWQGAPLLASSYPCSGMYVCTLCTQTHSHEEKTTIASFLNHKFEYIHHTNRERLYFHTVHCLNRYYFLNKV